MEDSHLIPPQVNSGTILKRDVHRSYAITQIIRPHQRSEKRQAVISLLHRQAQHRNTLPLRFRTFHLRTPRLADALTATDGPAATPLRADTRALLQVAATAHRRRRQRLVRTASLQTTARNTSGICIVSSHEAFRSEMTERASVVASKRQRQVQPRTAKRVTQRIRPVRVDQARCRHLRKGNPQAGHSAGIEAVWSGWDSDAMANIQEMRFARCNVQPAPASACKMAVCAKGRFDCVNAPLIAARSKTPRPFRKNGKSGWWGRDEGASQQRVWLPTLAK